MNAVKPFFAQQVIFIVLVLYVVMNVITEYATLIYNSHSGVRPSLNSTSSYDSFTVVRDNYMYQPSTVEQYVLDHAHELGLDDVNITINSTQASCNLIRNASLLQLQADPLSLSSLSSSTKKANRNIIKTYLKELKVYNKLVNKILLNPISDIRKRLRGNETNIDVCKDLLVHPDGIRGIFVKTAANDNSHHMLSYSTHHGYSEPLLPPLRHPDICTDFSKNLMRLDYLVHDFYEMCLSIQPHTRFVLVDIGASLVFHGTDPKTAPALYLSSLYSGFGFPFDHIYAYEITKSDPIKIFQNVPDPMRAAYHWINIGVSANVSDPVTNPLRMILDNYDEHDLVIVKLDIDTPSVEVPLTKQLLRPAASDSSGDYYDYGSIVDHFYFEHHVQQAELKSNWGDKVNGSIHESLQLFQQLRHKGIMAHYWV